MFKNISFFKNERGQSLTLVAIAMTVLLGFSAIAIDAGYLYLQKRQAQNTADAAALAGARALIDGSDSVPHVVYNYVKEYVENNGFNESDILNAEEIKAISRSNGDTEVPVSLKTSHGLFLARAIGFNSADVVAHATAQKGAIVEMGNLIPIGIPREVIGSEIGQGIDVIEFQMSFGPGNWGWISFDGSKGFNNNKIAGYLLNGYPDPVEIGDIIDTSTGTLNSHMEDAIDLLITSKKIVAAPIIEAGSVGTGTSEFVIDGFAQIILTSRTGQGGKTTISGQVIKNPISSGEINPDKVISEFDAIGIRIIH